MNEKQAEIIAEAMVVTLERELASIGPEVKLFDLMNVMMSFVCAYLDHKTEEAGLTIDKREAVICDLADMIKRTAKEVYNEKRENQTK